MSVRFDDWEGEHLEHYGVLGMKWGHHKNPQAAFTKAAAKLDKLQKNTSEKELIKTKAKLKMQKALSKQSKVEDKYRVEPDDPDYASYKKKSDKAYSASSKATKAYENADFKATKASYKEQKWAKAMVNTFGTTNYSEFKEKNQGSIDKGKTETEILFKPRNKS